MSYSLDFRKRVIGIMARDKMSIRKAATHFDLSTQTILRWTKSIDKKAITGRPRTLTDEMILNDISHYPDAFQYERAQRLACSTFAIYSALKRLQITRKKLSKTP
jgi:transposase